MGLAEAGPQLADCLLVTQEPWLGAPKRQTSEVAPVIPHRRVEEELMVKVILHPSSGNSGPAGLCDTGSRKEKKEERVKDKKSSPLFSKGQ